MSEIKEHISHMIKQGHTEAKFGSLDNAQYFKHLLESKLKINAKLTTIVGHATTVDTHPSVKLAKHFHVLGIKSSAHNVLGKFI